jgi:hypothetical protein
MARALALLLSMIAFIFCTATSTAVRAQPARALSHAQQLADLPHIKDAIVKAIGTDAGKVELNATPSVFRVVLVNGKMNDASPAGRENEASAISSIVSRAMANKPGFKRVAAIRVEYVIRSGEKGKPKIVDMIEFRKDKR